MNEYGVSWSEDQWTKIRAATHDESLHAKVAASYLPLFGPLSPDAETVPKSLYRGAVDALDGAKVLDVDDTSVLRLCTLAVNIRLRGAQVADPELASAQIMFRRAAAIISRIEDAMIFNGQASADAKPKEGIDGLEDVYRISGGGDHPGLLSTAPNVVKVAAGKSCTGQEVFSGIVKAITALESAGHYGPFACVLGDEMFQAVNTPVDKSMVLPRDSILPYLNGPFLRSSAVPAKRGLVQSLQAEPVEIVVAQEISVRYLQATIEGRHVFRVSERFVLRVKEPNALVRLEV